MKQILGILHNPTNLGQSLEREGGASVDANENIKHAIIDGIDTKGLIGVT